MSCGQVLDIHGRHLLRNVKLCIRIIRTSTTYALAEVIFHTVTTMQTVEWNKDAMDI